MKQLFLEDLKNESQTSVKEHLITEYGATKEALKNLQVLIAYESVGSWGCDSSSFFLFKDKTDGKFYANHGSHCSCYGFEDQFDPEECTLDYLKSDKFYFSTGGYDEDGAKNKDAVKEFIKNLRSTRSKEN